MSHVSHWKIERRSGVCVRCERVFEDGEKHASTLSVTGEALARADLCAGCWSQAPAARGERAADTLFWWFTRHTSEKRKTLQLDLASLERLFVELEGRPEARVRELRYVLCLLLMRKRRLKLEKVEREEAGESFLVRRPRRDERLRVFAFDFDAARIAEVRSELQAIFDGVDEGGVALGSEEGEAEAPGAPGRPEQPEPSRV